MTVALFDTAAHRAASSPSVGLWLALAAMFVTLMVLLSAATGRQATAAGIGIGVYVALFVLTGFPVGARHHAGRHLRRQRRAHQRP